jgi:hypothetical protein
MNVRHFTRASGDFIAVNVGNTPQAMGPATCVALIKKSSDTSNFEFIFTANSSSADPHNWLFYAGLGGDNKLSLWQGVSDLEAPFTITVAEDWLVVAVSKTSGTTAPRFHKCVLSTGIWTHQDSPSTGADSTAGSPSTSNIGNSSGHTSSGAFDGHILAVATFNTALSDAAIEAYSTRNFADFGALVTGWLATTPRTMYRLDQASVATALTDLTGSGADQTAIGGTSVVTNDDPPFGALPAISNPFRGPIGMKRPIVRT